MPMHWSRTIGIFPASGSPRVGLRALPPAVVLADLYADPQAWQPDIDDLDVPDDSAAVRSASQLLTVEPMPLE
jgi:hypothetical protein